MSEGVLLASNGLKPGVWLILLQPTEEQMAPDHRNLAPTPASAYPQGAYILLTRGERDCLVREKGLDHVTNAWRATGFSIFS